MNQLPKYRDTTRPAFTIDLLSSRMDGFPQLVKDAILIIEGNYEALYGIDDLASQLEVSKHHLIRSFTDACQISPGKYLTLIRMENAKSLLCLGERIPLELVAAACGYSCANYFSKAFKKITGQTPMEYAGNCQVQGTPSDLQNTIQKMYL